MSAADRPHDKYFPQTSWTLLDGARGLGPEAQLAQEEFARRYSRPVRDFIAALTGNLEQAEEWSQDFFADIVVPGRLLAKVDAQVGGFRPFLKQAVRNYVNSKFRWRSRLKRHPQDEVRPDAWSDDGWDRLNLQTATSPDVAYHQAWVRALLNKALTEVKWRCEQRGQIEHLSLFLGRYLSDSSEPPSWRALGTAFGLDEKNARSRADTVARQLRTVLRQLLRDELGSEDAIEAEIAELLASL